MRQSRTTEVKLGEVQPVWRGAPGEKMEHPVAKATYVKSQAIWKIYWQRADLKWHRYEPDAEVGSLETFLAVVEKDEFGCFYVYVVEPFWTVGYLI